MARLSEAQALDLFEAVVSVVSAHYRLGRAELLTGRTKAPTKARQIGMYLMHMRGATITLVGELFGGRARPTVRHALRTVEDERDKDGFDAVMDQLEIKVIRARRGGADVDEEANEARAGSHI